MLRGMGAKVAGLATQATLPVVTPNLSVPILEKPVSSRCVYS